MKPIASFMKTCALAGICLGLAFAGSVVAGLQQNPGTDLSATQGKVVVKTLDGGKVITLKHEEQIAFMFVGAIDELEHNCGFYGAEPCTLEVLIRGPKPKDASSPVGKLKFDPNATDPNYTYKVVLDDGDWKIWANPRKPGLGGIYIKKGLHGGTWYNPAGPASEKDMSIGETSIDMSFRLRR
jgi:hypothetical protein